jgi:hypothetical protein
MPPLSPDRQLSWTAVSIGSAKTLRVLSGTKAPQLYGGHLPSLENAFRVWFGCVRRCWCFPGNMRRSLCSRTEDAYRRIRLLRLHSRAGWRDLPSPQERSDSRKGRRDCADRSTPAQVSWAARLPAERAAVMLRSASIMEARHGEIVDWLIRESGSTRVKAELEWQFVHAVTLEAASLPHRMEGRILPLVVHCTTEED